MKFSIPAALRGVFFSLSALVVFFLAYLAANTVLIGGAIDLQQYAHISKTIVQQLKQPDETDTVLKSLAVMQRGGTIASTSGAIELAAIDAVLAPEPNNISAVIGAIKSGRLDLAQTEMARLSTQVTEKAASKVALLKTVQIVVAVLTALLYLMLVAQLLKRVSAKEQTDTEARHEAQGILNTVSEGLFLMKNDYEIGIEQSASLKEMFRSERDLQGNFFDFINQYVTPSTVQIARDYLELLFGDRVKEKLVEDLNPLKQVEVHIVRRDGSFESRYLDFSFKRVIIGGKLSHLLCSVSNVTKQVTLERELANAQEEQEAQLDLLMSVLHVDSSQLATFFNSTEVLLNNINQRLEEQSDATGQSNRELRAKLDDIARDAHQIKGDAAALGLNKFEFISHDFEGELEKLKSSRESLTGKDLLGAVGKLRDMFNELENMRNLVAKFASILAEQSRAARPAQTAVAAPSIETAALLEVGSEPDIAKQIVAPLDAPASDVNGVQDTPASALALLESLSQTVASRHDKQVSVNIIEYDNDSIGAEMQQTFSNIMVQLVRNSIVHGIETPAQRELLGKPSTGVIEVSLTQDENAITLTVKDDGQGLNAERIVARAIALGLLPNTDIADIPTRVIMGLIFKPGFSSNDEVDLDSGRGVGLDLVAQQARKLRGRINVGQKAGQYCQFKFTFPRTQASAI